MAGLPHYNNADAARNRHEPFYGNLFEVNILPPASVGDGGFLLEHVTSIGGLITEPGQEVAEQKYKQATRSYASGVPSKTTCDLTIGFSLNLNAGNEVYTYKKIRDWKRLIWNPLTGEQSLKKDYIGTIIVTCYTRTGDIFWVRTFHECFPTGDIPELALAYDAAEPVGMEMNFRADWWSESMV